MGFHGVVSKGCEICRQRKIKCDQTKPKCLRCGKANLMCPGFRDLSNVLFRNESERVIRKAHESYAEKKHLQLAVGEAAMIRQDDLPTDMRPVSSTYFNFPYTTPSPGISEHGASFFFANYTCDEPPLSKDYHSWLINTYCDSYMNHALRASIEAAGLAGIANKFHAPRLLSQSRQAYGRALLATKRALSDPMESKADVTLITVIILGMFELINCNDWDQHRSWATHIQGATALLQHRGPNQFNRERGGQLYRQLLSQVLLSCSQQDIPVPEAVIQLERIHRSNGSGGRASKSRPNLIRNVCFRLLHIRSEMKSGRQTSKSMLRQAAIEMDQELEDWKAVAPSDWNYRIIDSGDVADKNTFEGKRHEYSNHALVQVWNNWRTLRILVNKIIFEDDTSSLSQNVTQSTSLIRELSTEICTSALNLFGSPRAATLIWPLYVVSGEPACSTKHRRWAVEQLRRINSSIGIRQAALLADKAEQSMVGL